MNVIVIAAIALVAMVVLIMIFIGRARTFGSGVESCTDKGGECTSGFSACMGKGGATVPGTECDKSDEVCCIIFKEDSGGNGEG